MTKVCKRIHDFDGNEVKASDIVQRIVEGFEAGKVVTLRNNEYSFWAEVVCVKQIGKRYFFRSVMYGWHYIVNLNNNTVLLQQ